MVSPLKTWHHPQPKGLWPAVTGLAVATHIGILGLSLPYVLNLMRSGESQAADFVPVELIEVAPDNVSQEVRETSESAAVGDVVTPSDSTETEQLAPAEPTVSATPDSVLTATTDSEVSSVSTPVSTPEPKAESEEVEPVAEPESEPEEENATPEEESSSDDRPTAEPSAETTSKPADEPESVNESVISDSDVESNTLPDDTSSEVTEPPVIPGEQALPTPGEGETAVSSSQVAYIKVVGHSYVPEELRRDITDTLPEPVAYSGAELDSELVGCGRINFPVGQVAYRVVVDPTGAVRQALTWTGGIEGQQMSEGERAIACLIESAGFSFTPATSTGTPVANSDLILTLDVIESGSN